MGFSTGVANTVLVLFTYIHTYIYIYIKDIVSIFLQNGL